MKTDDAITLWIKNLKSGDDLAAQQLWEHYFRRLVGFASGKLAGANKRVAAEEDIALSAFKSLCFGAEQGRFPQLTDRENLWPLLVVLTSRKASQRVRHERRLKRGGGRTLSEADFTDENELQRLDQVLGSEPNPEDAVEMSEACERLLGLLDDDARAIALAKLAGYANTEIAEQRSMALRSVERKLQLIRRIWEEDGLHE